MKLLRYGLPGQEKPGLCDASGTIRDLSGIVDDIAGESCSGRRLRASARSIRDAARRDRQRVSGLRGSGRQDDVHRVELLRPRG